MHRLLAVSLTLAVAAALSAAVLGQAPAADWPQWRGPDRTGLSKETGLLRQWPAAGPAVAWSASGLGAGYGSVAVSGDRMFVQGARGRASVVLEPQPRRRQGRLVEGDRRRRATTTAAPGPAARRRSTAIGSTC